jgi:protein O-GlcNAc transferase
MTVFREWLASCSQAWLNRFRRQHGLADAPSTRQEAAASEPLDRPLVLLHVGCGHATIGQIQLPGFQRAEPAWSEVRLDADEQVCPDIVGSMTDMSVVPDGFADAVFTSHGIEHLYWHDVPLALREFHRVLGATGFLVISCPDVQSAAEMIAEDRMFDTAYVSPAGPITPFDILYSYRPFVEANPEWMSHHCGFTLSTLIDVVRQAGFVALYGFRSRAEFNLWLLASKSERTADELTRMASLYLPSHN